MIQNVEETQVKLLIDILPSLKSDSARARVIDTLALLASRANVSNEENKVCAQLVTEDQRLTISGNRRLPNYFPIYSTASITISRTPRFSLKRHHRHSRR